MNNNEDTYYNGQSDLFSQSGEDADSEASQQDSQTGKPVSEKESGQSLNRRVRLTLWLIGIVGIISFLLAVSHYWNRSVEVKDINVKGNHFTSEELVKSKLQTSVGIQVDSLDFMRSIQSVETMPYIKRAYLNMTPNGILQVQVEERQPIALCASGSKKLYFDEEGILLPVVQERPVNVPLVYGFNNLSPGDTLQGSTFETIKNFMHTLRNNDLAHSTISEIAFVEGEGLVAITQGKRIRLIFGESNFSRKVNYWETFYDKVAVNNPLTSVNEIDLRYEGQIITRS